MTNKARIILRLLVGPIMTAIACAGLSPASPVSKPANQMSAVPAFSVTATPPPIQPTATAQLVSPQEMQSTAPAAVSGLSSDLVLDQSTLEHVYKTVNPAVVNIQVLEQANPYGGRRRRSSGSAIALGSGFVWDAQGHIVTNNHVVSGASSISVAFADNTSADATVVGTDPNVDLAVIKVDAPSGRVLQPVQIADSRQLQVGQIAIAIGNPFGLQNTATLGIISGLSRTLPSGLGTASLFSNGPTYSIPDIIQTDASINLGNSGGVLVDLQGAVLGVTSAIESATQSNAGIGFVIPAEIVNGVVPVLIAKGSYPDPWIGIDGIDLNSAIGKTLNLAAGQQGILVTDVTAGAAADQAGLQAGNQPLTVGGQDIAIGGDIITAVNGQPVVQYNALNAFLVLHTTQATN